MKRKDIWKEILSLVLIIVIMVVLNFIFTRMLVRVDLTENKIYSLTPASKQAVSNLNDIMIVKVYMSEKLPPSLMPIKERVSDLLDEYRAYSHGNLKIEFIDPARDKKAQQEVRMLGIPPVEMNILEKDRLQVVKGYLGLAIFYLNKHQVIPVIQSTDDLEYQITSRILKLTENRERVVGFVVKGGNHDLYGDYETARKRVESEFKVVEIDSIIPDSIDVLVVAGISKLDTAMLYRINQYIMNGGKAILLIDGVDVQGLSASSVPEAKLDLVRYGVKVNQNLVLDISNEMAPFSSGVVRFIVPYPFWVKIRNFDKTNPIVSKLNSLVLPWTSSIEPIKDSSANYKVTILAKSTDHSWEQKGFFLLSPDYVKVPPKDKLSQYDLVALVRGKIPSPFKEPPKGFDKKKFKRVSDSTFVVIVGNSRFLENPFAGSFKENLVFFMNALDYLSFGKQLINVRTKVLTERPIAEVSDATKTAIRILNIVLMPLLVVIFGLVRYSIRRKRRR